jgi:TatD DNase family protein
MTYRNVIDSHFHTQSMLQRGMDVFSLYDRLFEGGFAGGIDIGCTHDDLPQRRELLKDYPAILLSGAMGPWEAGRSETKPVEPEYEYQSVKSVSQIESELAILRENIIRYKASFIGEIGLDYYWDYGTHEKQHLIFETQMRWASEMGLRVLIHDRDADAETADVIRRLGPDRGGVIHCFDGSPVVLEAALEKGYFISFAGNLTYKKNTDLRQMLRRVPLDRLLLETDSPYLAPVPLRGQSNNPSFIIHTYECAAETLGMNAEDLAIIIKDNYDRLTASV